MQESEFSLEINTENLKLHPRGVFVIYDWEWEEEDVSTCEETSEELLACSYTSVSSELMSPSPQPQFITEAAMTHTLVFKCIGAVRDERQQNILEAAYQARQAGETVPVKIEPEPTNPYDSKAICFKCQIRNVWSRIGYIVREVLDEVHKALQDGHIVCVKLAWVKFLLQWTRSGPGFYAGIYITRRGEWSDKCIKSASTK